MAKTRAQKNKAIRQDALREYMAERGSVQYLFDLIEKLEALDVESETFQQEYTKIKAAIEVRARLLGKYLPELKATEITGEDGGAVTIKMVSYAD